MILYDYQCLECGNVQEQYQLLKDVVLNDMFCKNCNKTVQCNKVITKTSFKVPEDGWSKTGYSKNLDKVKAQL